MTNKQIFGFFALALLAFSVCACARNVSSAGNRNTGSGPQTKTSVKGEEALAPELITLLKQEAGILRPFAWREIRISEPIIEVVGIDEEERLINAIVIREGNQYRLKHHGVYPLQETDNKYVEKSGLLQLRDYVPDTEFPFRSEILSSGDCQVHFILVQQALTRSFNTHESLTEVSVRIIIQKGTEVISNTLEGPLFLGVNKTLIRDINGDGKLDYLLIGSYKIQSMYLWTVENDCTVMHIRFGDKNDIQDYLEDNELFLKPDSRGRCAIYSKNYEVLTKGWKVTESKYEWDGQARIYRKIKESRKLEKD